MKKLTLCQILFLIVYSGFANAAIKEPDNIYYGQIAVQGVALTAADTNYSVSVNLDGVELDSYTMGESGDGSNLYKLQVPVDSVGERLPNYTRSGDILEFKVSDGGNEVFTATNMVYERGNILLLDLGTLDADQDDIDDASDNCVNTANTDQANADSDAAGDACDDFPNNPNETQDQDSDGMGDNFEIQYGFNPNNAADADLDADNDGKTNLEEFQNETDPLIANNSAPVQVPMPIWSLGLMLMGVLSLGLRKQRQIKG